MRRFNPYADRKCADGVFCDGWRKVKKGGKVKAAGVYYEHDSLKGIEGELVHVQMHGYWMEEVLISRGAIGCKGALCVAKAIEK